MLQVRTIFFSFFKKSLGNDHKADTLLPGVCIKGYSDQSKLRSGLSSVGLNRKLVARLHTFISCYFSSVRIIKINDEVYGRRGVR